MQYTSIVYGYSSSRICGGSDHCAWPEVTSVTWPEMPSVMCYVRKYVLRKRNRKLRHIRPSGAFRPEMTVTWPGAVLTGSMFCACPAFSPAFFFLSSSTVVPWLPDVTEDHLTPFGFLLGVRMHNRRSCDPFGSVHGVFSTTSASYNHRKPRVLYLAWLLELALVICPFYFRIVSI